MKKAPFYGSLFLGARLGDIALATLIDREKSTSIEMLLELEMGLEPTTY